MREYACTYTGILLMLLMTGCKTTKTGLGKSDNVAMQQLNLGKFDDSTNKIVFLTFDVTLIDSAGETYLFKPVNKTFADGILKKRNINKTENPEQGYFYCELSDNKKQTIDLIKTEDPLNRVYEFPSDGSNALGKALVKTRSASLFLRFQYNSNAKYLGVYKFSSLTKKFKNIYYAELLP